MCRCMVTRSVGTCSKICTQCSLSIEFCFFFVKCGIKCLFFFSGRYIIFFIAVLGFILCIQCVLFIMCSIYLSRPKFKQEIIFFVIKWLIFTIYIFCTIFKSLLINKTLVGLTHKVLLLCELCLCSWYRVD